MLWLQLGRERKEVSRFSANVELDAISALPLSLCLSFLLLANLSPLNELRPQSLLSLRGYVLVLSKVSTIPNL